MASFLEKLRIRNTLPTPGLQLGGSSGANPDDLFSQFLRAARSYGPSDDSIGTSGNLRRMTPPMGPRVGPSYADNVSKTVNPMQGGRINADVIYDPRPELQNRQLDIEQSKVDALTQDKMFTRDIKLGDQAIRKQRADAYEFKARNPNMKLQAVKGGNIMAFDPITGQMSDTGISSGSLSDEDKIKLGLESSLTQIGARGDEATELEGLRQKGRVELEEEKQKGRIDLKKEVPGQAPAKPLMPTQERVAKTSRAQELVEQNPALSNYIAVTRDDKGTVTGYILNDPSKGIPGADKDVYTKISKYINEGGSNPFAKENTPQLFGPSNKPDETGIVEMIAPDGGTLKVPANEVKAMEAKGAKRKKIASNNLGSSQNDFLNSVMSGSNRAGVVGLAGRLPAGQVS